MAITVLFLVNHKVLGIAISLSVWDGAIFTGDDVAVPDRP